MARSQKPRKAYRHRQVHLHAAANAIARQHPMTDDQTTDLGIAYWTALDGHMRNPTDTQWGVLASTCNIALILAERGYGIEHIEAIKDALKGLQRAKTRAATGKSWAMDSDGLLSLRLALQIHDEQVKSAATIEMRNAVREVHRRINQGITYGAEVTTQ